MPPAQRAALPLAVQIGILLFAVSAMLKWFPVLPRMSDECNFVATSFKMLRDGRLTSAAHSGDNILLQGMHHKPVKMPAYLVILAGWLAVFPNPDDIRVMNLTVYAVAILLLWRFVTVRAAVERWPLVLVAGVALATMPLSAAYANTAMMESWVLLAATAHFLSWYALAGRADRHVCFMLTAFIAIMFKESLVLLTGAIVLVHWREFWQLHVEAWRRNRGATLIYCASVLAMALATLSLLQNRGLYPNFRTELIQAPVAERLPMLWDHFLENVRMFLTLRHYPIHYLHIYTAIIFALATGLALWRWRTRDAKLYRSVLLFYALNLVFVFVVYENSHFRGQRIYAVSEALVVAACFLALVRPEVPRFVAGFLGIAVAALNLFACVELERHFIRAHMHYPETPHILTSMGLPREGDCLLSAFDWQFLYENPACELIYRIPYSVAETQSVINIARPRFVILPKDWQWNTEHYREIGTVPPSKGATGGLRLMDQTVWMRID